MTKWRILLLVLLCALAAPAFAQQRDPLESMPSARRADRFEPNNDRMTAALVAPGSEVGDLSFVCPPYTAYDCGGDQDYFQIQAKGGMCYSAQIVRLDPALDTALRLYDAAGTQLAENDDRKPGDPRSRAKACLPTSAGATVLYIQIWNVGNRLPPEPVAQRLYAFRVDVTAPPPTPRPTERPTAVPTTAPVLPPVVPTEVPRMPDELQPTEALPTAEPQPTAPPSTPAVRVTVRTPTPVAAPLAKRVSVALSIQVRSWIPAPKRTPTPQDGQPLRAVRVQLLDAFGMLLAEGLTDEAGLVQLRRDVPAGSAVFIALPALGLQVPVQPEQQQYQISIPEVAHD